MAKSKAAVPFKTAAHGMLKVASKEISLNFSVYFSPFLYYLFFLKENTNGTASQVLKANVRVQNRECHVMPILISV